MISSPMYQPQDRYRILYAGVSHTLLKSLRQNLGPKGCEVVRCPDGWQARLFVQSKIHYDLLLFDDELSGLSCADLCSLAALLSHRQHTPVLIHIGEGLQKRPTRLTEWELVSKIMSLLGLPFED